MNRIDIELSRREQKQHALALMKEVRELESRIQPTDTGHIITTTNVLMDRIEEILDRLAEGK
tara:strand:+ start:790 stop:975 length:186 start_codon:yes stop_codon:yes gene_type:complete